MSALRFVYRNTSLSDKHPIAMIIACVEKMLWFRSLQGRGYCGYTYGSAVLVEEVTVEEFRKFLRDNAGINMKLEMSVSPLTGEKELYIKYAKRKVNFFKASSTGKQELLLLFYWTSFAVNDVSFLFIDVEAFYHFERAAKIVMDVSKRRNLQAFFTSHNMYLANNSIMRPDCFFIILPD